MCFGLTEDDDGGTPVLDDDAEPWNGIKKQDIKPIRIEYTEKITQRISLMFTESDRVHQHKPAHWSLAKCIQWLQAGMRTIVLLIYCNIRYRKYNMLVLPDKAIQFIAIVR